MLIELVLAQMNESEFWECRRMVIDYLTMYQRQPTKLPRLQLSWSVSRRTLHKMKPSTRAAQDLEPIMEDEDCNSLGLGCDDGDESSIFDRYIFFYSTSHFRSYVLPASEILISLSCVTFQLRSSQHIILCNKFLF